MKILTKFQNFIYFIIALLTLCASTTAYVYSNFETKEDAQSKFERIEKKIDKLIEIHLK